MKFILSWIVTALAVGMAVWIVPGIDIISTVESWVAVALIGLVLAAINMSIKPILQILSLPVTIITLGIFYVVVNTLMLYLAAWAVNGIFQVGFHIDSFGSAFVASIVISLVSVILGAITGTNKD